MRAVILDLKGLDELNLSSIENQVDELKTYGTTPEEKVLERIKGFDIVITNKTAITDQVLQQTKSIKLICVLATGTNVVDKHAAYDRGIPVCNCVAYGVDSVVQHVWSLILALHNNLLSYSKDVSRGEWQRSDQFCFIDHPIVELKGRTLGVIGHGNLGKGVVKIASAFGMDVIICQKIGGDRASVAADTGIPFDEFIQQADVISLHCPLTPATENLFTREVFQRMKPGAFLVNAARGGIVNEQALADALKEGVIAGAATDVITEEPPVNGNVLLAGNIPNLLVTPHIAWASLEARSRIVEQTADNIAAYIAGAPIRTV